VLIEEKMTNKAAAQSALLVVVCLVLVSTVPAEEGVYKDCYHFCVKTSLPTKKSHSLCEKYCDDECVGVEYLGKIHFMGSPRYFNFVFSKNN
jgi:hypothetical protein